MKEDGDGRKRKGGLPRACHVAAFDALGFVKAAEALGRGWHGGDIGGSAVALRWG